MLAVSAVTVIAAFFAGSVTEMLPGFWRILTSSQALTTDGIALGGVNGVMLNAGLLGFISVLVLKAGKVEAGGLSIGVFFLTYGIGYFGINCLNVWPILLGTWLCSKARRVPFGQYAHIALLATALAPAVSELLFPRYLDIPLYAAIPCAVVGGALLGFLMPGMCAHAAGMHKGHTLFNGGLSAGLLAVLFFAVYKNIALRIAGTHTEYALNSVLSDGSTALALFYTGIFAVSVVLGLILDRGPGRYIVLIKRTGFGEDFTKLDTMGCFLINFGLLGLLALGYFALAGARFTGPLIGSVLCIVCWSGMGSHPRNVIPIFVGYVLVSLISGNPLSSAGLAVGVCYAAGMSPLCGRWGWYWGIAAGALHACLVQNTAVFHGGLNLYNGGFTTGLVVVVLVHVLENFFTDVPTRRARRMELRSGGQPQREETDGDKDRKR